jgi:hypothetical protein
MKPAIVWTDDCQGKKNYDGSILSISCRYWPHGGGFHLLDTSKLPSDEAWQGNEKRPEIKPSASVSLTLDYFENEEEKSDPDNHSWNDLISADFEGETEEEVKAKVEKWVQDVFDDIVKIITEKYPIKPVLCPCGAPAQADSEYCKDCDDAATQKAIDERAAYDEEGKRTV